MNDLGKPDAGNPPVRFDEGREVIPRAYSTSYDGGFRELGRYDLFTNTRYIFASLIELSSVLGPKVIPASVATRRVKSVIGWPVTTIFVSVF